MSPGSGGNKENGFLGEGIEVFGEDSGIGKAEVVRLAEDDVIEHSDSEDLRSRRQPFGALTIFHRGRRVSGGMIMLCAAPSYVASTESAPSPSGAALY